MSRSLQNINTTIEKNNLIEALELLNKFEKTELNTISKKLQRSFISLKLKYHMENFDYDIVMDILMKNDNLMKRDYLKYITCKHISEYEKVKMFNEKVKDNFILLPKDIDDLVDNQCHCILSLLDGYYYKSTKETIYKKFKNLNKYKLNENELNESLDIFKNLIPEDSYNDLISKLDNVDLILDGCNILHHKNGEINYTFLYDFLNNLKEKNYLLVIHKRHFNKKELKKEIVKKIFTEFNDKIFLTPYKYYDDFYLLISMLYRDIPIVTNDNFFDHIFLLKEIDDKYKGKIKGKINDLLTNYNNFKINNILNYSNCIQVYKKNIYIPVQ